MTRHQSFGPVLRLLHDIDLLPRSAAPCQSAVAVVDSWHKVAASTTMSNGPVARRSRTSGFFVIYADKRAARRNGIARRAMKICLSAMEKANTPRRHPCGGTFQTMSASFRRNWVPLHESTVVGGRLVSRA
ncbi:MAG: hypothetical protein ACLSHC_01775 [Bilophila wadsworthia]